MKAHNDFIDEYHRLALDADEPMWKELRQLRMALDVMLLWAEEGDSGSSEIRVGESTGGEDHA